MDDENIVQYLLAIDDSPHEATLRKKGISLLILMELEHLGYTYSRLYKRGRYTIVRHYVSKQGRDYLLSKSEKDK